MKRKFLIRLGLLIACCLLVLMLTFGLAACAKSKPTVVTQDGITYEIDRGVYTVSSAEKSLTEAVILSEYEGIPVTTISNHAFSNCSSLISVIIPDSITTINHGNNSRGAFSGCTSLKKIDIPDSVSLIGQYAFYGCESLENLTFGNGLTTIGGWAFWGCASLENIIIPESVTQIGEAAFASCSALKSINIPENVTQIGAAALSACTALTEINYNAVNSRMYRRSINCYTIMAYQSQPENEIVLNVGANVKIIPQDMFNCESRTSYDSLYGSKLIVNFTENSQCEIIGDSAFCNCISLKNIDFPNSLTSIAGNAFKNCTSLNNINMPNGLTSIGDYAFSGCTAKIEWGNNPTIEKIGAYAFAGYKGNKFIVPDSVLTIDENAFSDSAITEVITPLNLVSSFSDLPIRSLVITEGTNIPSNYFDKFVNLEQVTLPSTIISIGSSAFAKCEALWAVKISDLSAWCNINFENETANPLFMAHNLYINGEYAYKITIPETVTAISDYAFDFCTSIVSVTLPNNLVAIGTSSFENCYKLIEVYNLSSLNIEKRSENYGCVGLNAYNVYSDSSDESQIIYGDSGYIYLGNFDDSFSEITVVGLWKELESVSLHARVSNLIITQSIVRNYAFYNCGFIKDVKIFATKEMNETVFYGCKNIESADVDCEYICFVPKNSLKELRLSSGIKTYDLEDEAFKGNTNLKSLALEFYGTVGESAFSGCTSLEKVSIGDLSVIGNNAFSDCTKLSEITYNASECEFGYGVFANAGIEGGGVSVKFGALVTQIPSHMFSVGSIKDSPIKLNEITIPDGVTSIGSGAFSGCNKLIQKENGVLYVDKWIIDCDNTVTEVTLRNDTKGIADSAFSYCSKLTSITIPDSVTYIGNYAFENCSGLTSITIPDSVTSIGDYAFKYCNGLTSITIPDSVTSIGRQAFNNCSRLIIYCEAESKPSGCDDNWNGGGVIIRVPVIWDCKKNNKDENGYEYATINGLRYKLKNNDATLFYQPSNLSGDIVIPAIVEFKSTIYSVTSIDNKAFSGCSGLTSITVDENNTVYASQDGILYNKAKTEFVHIPDNIQGAITIPDSVTSIGDDAFRNCNSLTSITIGNGVTSIGWDAFSGCSGLTSITIPDSVTSIGYYAFNNCSGLTSITIPNGVTYIGNSAFSGCTNLQYNEYDNGLYLGNSQDKYLVLVKAKSTGITSCMISESTKVICYSAFSSCSGLTSITIPDSVTSIGYDAFNNCSGLTSVYYGATVDKWNEISINQSNESLIYAMRYYYIENETDVPKDEGNYWYYADGEIVVWTKEN
ncbi:MAG: leucine-rich repeat domain-containing protein [Roseburia sp.]|nr:leucine-rich repeat domain-containing protein [Roseburia sp.]